MKRFGHTVRHILSHALGHTLSRTLVGFTALTMLLLACNREPDTNNASGTVKVRIPFPVEGGGYSLQVIALSGINSLYEFSGSHANFYMSPSVAGSRIHGVRPKGHFVKAGDVYVPEPDAQNLSQQMAVVYAHLQRLHELDTELGVGDLNEGPTDIGLMVRFPSHSGMGLELNNAFYSAETDAILIVPYTADELPLAVNGGILAHEHFHSLFYKLLGRQLSNKMQAHGGGLKAQLEGKSASSGDDAGTDTGSDGESDTTTGTPGTLAQRTNLMIYLGMNEGLADFWAWVYTGDTEFMAATVPEEAKLRSTKLTEAQTKSLSLHSSDYWTPRASESREKWPIYDIGTEYARTMTAFSKVVERSRGLSSVEARKLVAKTMLRTLPSLALTLKSIKATDYFEPAGFLALLSVTMKDIKPEEKAFLAGVVQRSGLSIAVGQK